MKTLKWWWGGGVRAGPIGSMGLRGGGDGGSVGASDGPGTGAQAVAEPKEAKDILLRMAEFVARTPRFSVNVQDTYDAAPGFRPEGRIQRDADNHP